MAPALLSTHFPNLLLYARDVHMYVLDAPKWNMPKGVPFPGWGGGWGVGSFVLPLGVAWGSSAPCSRGPVDKHFFLMS